MSMPGTTTASSGGLALLASIVILAVYLLRRSRPITQ